jgi:hypothetical protein
MRPQSAKAKGRRHQQAIAANILETFPELQEDDVCSRPMGSPGEDIMLSPVARELLPFSFEAKNVERLNVWDAFRQAETNSRGATPAVVMRKNNTKPLCVMRWNDFLSLARRAYSPSYPVPSACGAPPSALAASDAAALRRIADLIDGSAPSSTEHHSGADCVVDECDDKDGNESNAEFTGTVA